MSRRKPSYTRVVLAARAIHEAVYSFLRDSSQEANDEIKAIRLDPLNPKFLDRVIIELAATFDFPDAISMKYYIVHQMKIPESATKVKEPKMRPVVRQKKQKKPDLVPVAPSIAATLAEMTAKIHNINGSRLYKTKYPGLYEPIAKLMHEDDIVCKYVADDPDLVWA